MGCHCRVGHELMETLAAGLSEASRLRYLPVWRLCASGLLGPVPELSRLLLAYSLRGCGSSLRTLHDEVMHWRQSLLVLQTRSRGGGAEDSGESDGEEGPKPLRFVGAFIPFEWPWARRTAATTRNAGTASEARGHLWLFHISISASGACCPTAWPLQEAEGVRPRELMHASVESGLLFGGSTETSAPLVVSPDLEHGRLALPSRVLSKGCGEGAGVWREGGHGSCLKPWDFDIVDVELWAAEGSAEEGGLPFEFEYRNQQLNKRITKTVLGNLGLGGFAR